MKIINPATGATLSHLMEDTDRRIEEKYELVVYEADASASRFFSSTIENWKAQESYPGLEATEIPAGATEVDRINVYLGKNCRGVF